MTRPPQRREPIALAQPAPEPALLFGLPANTAAMMVMFLAAIDSLATILTLRSGRGVEVNPVMDWLHATGGETAFVFAKLILTGCCMAWVVHRARRLHARIATVAAFAIYAPIVCVHIYNNAIMIGLVH